VQSKVDLADQVGRRDGGTYFLSGITLVVIAQGVVVTVMRASGIHRGFSKRKKCLWGLIDEDAPLPPPAVSAALKQAA